MQQFTTKLRSNDAKGKETKLTEDLPDISKNSNIHPGSSLRDNLYTLQKYQNNKYLKIIYYKNDTSKN